MAQVLLSQRELSKRWGISPRTLERWRWQGEGLKYIKIGSAVRYRLGDIEDYEAKQLQEIGGENMINDGKQGEQIADNSTAKLGQVAEYTEEGYARHMLDAYKDKCRDSDEIKLYRALENALSHIDFMRVRVKDKLLEHQIEKSDLEDMIVKVAKIGLMGLDPEYSQFQEVENYLNSILFTYRRGV